MYVAVCVCVASKCTDTTRSTIYIIILPLLHNLHARVGSEVVVAHTPPCWYCTYACANVRADCKLYRIQTHSTCNSPF